MIYYFDESLRSTAIVSKWLEENEVQAVKRDVAIDRLTREEIATFFRLAEGSVRDILVARSLKFKEIEPRLLDMKMSELIEFAYHNPVVIKKPILVEKNKIMAGYNEEEISKFLPRWKKDILIGREL